MTELKSTLAARESEIINLKASLETSKAAYDGLTAAHDKAMELAVSRKELEVKLEMQKLTVEAYDKGYERAMKNLQELKNLKI